MGRYDDISDARLRYEIQRFARILQRMEEKDEVLERTADILTLLGELRRMVFAWEVRCTFRGDESESAGGSRSPEAEEGPGGHPESDSERIVREAREQHSQFLGGLPAGSGEDEPPSARPPEEESDGDEGSDPR